MQLLLFAICFKFPSTFPTKKNQCCLLFSCMFWNMPHKTFMFLLSWSPHWLHFLFFGVGGLFVLYVTDCCTILRRKWKKKSKAN